MGDLSVPDPRVTNPELFDLHNPNAPIPQFVNAMKGIGITVDPNQVASKLAKNYQVRQSANGKTFVLTTYTVKGDNDARYSMGFIAEQGERGEWIWGNLDISKAFALYGKEISVRAEPGGGKQNEGLGYFPDWVITTTSEEATYNPTGCRYPHRHGGRLPVRAVRLAVSTHACRRCGYAPCPIH